MSRRRRGKHIPQRTCIVCREKSDRRALTRIVRTANQGVVADPRGRLSGRGAYLCSRSTCWERALSSNLLDRALKTKVSPSEKKALAAYQPADTIEEAG